MTYTVTLLSLQENEVDQPAADYPSVPRERYRPAQYDSAHSIGSKKGPPSSGRANNRLRDYPQRQGQPSGARGRTQASSTAYNKGNNRVDSNRRYGASGHNGRYFSQSSSILPADDLFGIPSSSSSSSPYQTNRNRGSNNGYYGAPYDSMYPNSNDRGDVYNRGYPYKYGRSASPKKRRPSEGRTKGREGQGGINLSQEEEELKKERERKSERIAARIMRKRRRRQAKRHVGPHDDGGLQVCQRLPDLRLRLFVSSCVFMRLYAS